MELLKLFTNKFLFFIVFTILLFSCSNQKNNSEIWQTLGGYKKIEMFADKDTIIQNIHVYGSTSYTNDTLIKISDSTYFSTFRKDTLKINQ